MKEKGKDLGFNYLSRFTASKSDPNQVDRDSEVRLLSQLDPAPYHNGGDIHFGPDGYLYYRGPLPTSGTLLLAVPSA